ncbi:hypothetical protein BJ170DRAFT_623118 [Xylariales sp. AK1849]|nr:hypothetical protein BJ170DRAFT_623118 [Xylariales sp. AK1849]
MILGQVMTYLLLQSCLIPRALRVMPDPVVHSLYSIDTWLCPRNNASLVTLHLISRDVLVILSPSERALEHCGYLYPSMMQ